MTKYGIEDLISAAAEQKPSDFGDIFNDLIVDRLGSAIEDKKMEIARSMFNNSEELPEE